jgi:hypothetical protein
MGGGHLGIWESAASDGGGGVGDQFEYLSRPGGERGVAGVELDGFAGVDTLSHPPLGLRWDHPVLGRDLIPARLGVPGRLPCDVVQAATCKRLLGCCHDQRLGVVEVLAEAVVERVLAVPQEVVVEGGADTRPAGRGIATGENAIHALSLRRGERGDVDQSHHVGCSASTGDHGSAVGVADQ